MSKLVFFGGTCANNTWREAFIQELVGRGVPSEYLFNPVVADWSEEAQRREEEAKQKATYLIFYLADPQQLGNPLSYYSGVEATMALYDRPKATVVIFDNEGISGQFLKAAQQAERVLRQRHPNATIINSREQAIDWLAKQLTS